ncbi:MAG: hypothetical protein FWH54_05885 [Methanobrevibacter sp.]|nr:hypothetical protein [Methanobrevibacter sp.]
MTRYEDKAKEYYENRIRPEQLKYLLRPVIYSLLLAVPEGLTTEDITYLMNNTRGIRQYKLGFQKVERIMKNYMYTGNSTIFIKHGDKWKLRKLNRGCNV